MNAIDYGDLFVRGLSGDMVALTIIFALLAPVFIVIAGISAIAGKVRDRKAQRRWERDDG